MKPFVSYEKRMYYPYSSMTYLSRRRRELILKPYMSAVLEDISKVDIILDHHVNLRLLETIEEMVKLDSFIISKNIEFPKVLLRSESLSSSQIEYISASNKNILLHELQPAKKVETLIVKSGLDALDFGIRYEGVIDTTFIAKLASIMMGKPTDIRSTINWIGRANDLPHEAVYVPPHHECVPLYLKQWTDFVSRDDLHPLVKSIFAHAYFETIHPLDDGNGRIGRILILSILIKEKFMSSVFIPISLGILRRRDDYVRTLTQFREGNYQDIILFVLESILDVIPSVYQTLDDLIHLKHQWESQIKAHKDALIWKILDELLIRPVVDVAYLKDKFKMSDQAIRNAISKLLDYNIITPLNRNKRNVVYQSKDVLAILDAYLN